jgi:predicted nucleic acid-binding protein
MSQCILIASDTSGLIDIEVGGLTTVVMSQSNVTFCVPDVLFDQELRQRHSHLEALGLQLIPLSGESVARVFEKSQRHRKVSRMDLFALELAIEKRAILLTGDRHLRRIAEIYKIESHGTIWLVERMVLNNAISPDVARSAYKAMRAAGSRLPWDQAEEGLKAIEMRVPCSDHIGDPVSIFTDAAANDASKASLLLTS